MAYYGLLLLILQGADVTWRLEIEIMSVSVNISKYRACLCDVKSQEVLKLLVNVLILYPTNGIGPSIV